jgi:hypothetical protein
MKHWGEQDFTRWMFGLKEEDEHVRVCPQCQSEVVRLTSIRAGITAEPEVSHEFLAAQRRAIYTRLHEPSNRWMRARVWAPISAGVALAAVGVALMLPPKPAHQPLLNESDQKFFTEIGSIEQSAEPRAIQPIHNMFEE